MIAGVNSLEFSSVKALLLSDLFQGQRQRQDLEVESNSYLFSIFSFKKSEN